jgi:hypothetical protein
MAPTEWEHLVQRLNANYPGQQIDPLTSAEWFGPLAGFPASEVWDAIDRHRRTLDPGRDGQPLGHWAPSLAGILACIDANWRERAKARHALETQQAKTRRNSVGGTPMPPETKAAIDLLRRSTLLPGNPDRLDPKTARARIDVLAGQLSERLEREQTGTLA